MTSLIIPQKDKSLNQAYLWSIKAVFFKLGTINVHNKRHKMAPVAPLPWQQFCRKDISINADIPSLFLTKGDALPTS